MRTRLPFIPWSIAGVPSSQALPGYLITAPPSMCVPDVIGALAVWIQHQKKKEKKRMQEMCLRARRFRDTLLLHMHLSAFLMQLAR